MPPNDGGCSCPKDLHPPPAEGARSVPSTVFGGQPLTASLTPCVRPVRAMRRDRHHAPVSYSRSSDRPRLPPVRGAPRPAPFLARAVALRCSCRHGTVPHPRRPSPARTGGGPTFMGADAAGIDAHCLGPAPDDAEPGPVRPVRGLAKASQGAARGQACRPRLWGRAYHPGDPAT